MSSSMNRGLRRQALENGKTVSRKARARLGQASISSSPMVSPAGSRPSSRPASRANSRPPSQNPSTAGSSSDDDFEDELTEWTRSKHIAELTDAQFDDLFEKMEDRDFFKGSSKARAPIMSMYANSIAENFLGEDRPEKLEEMLPICLRCIKEGSDGPSTVSALRAIAITAISLGDDDGAFFGRVKAPLQECAEDASSAAGQAAAIRALSMVLYFAGADIEETNDTIEWLHEIVLSDGEDVNALDNAEVVAAAIHEWAFLSTLMPTQPGISSQALETLGEQLESNSPEVLSAASEAIATIYESGYTLRRSDDSGTLPLDVTEADEKVAWRYRRANWSQTYHFTNDNDYEIKSKLKELSKSPMRHVKKDARRELHAAFRDVSHALDYPWRGPRYSTAMNDDNYEFYGHRLRQGSTVIDRWWKLQRLAALKRTLQDGLGTHMRLNAAVAQALRSCLEASSRFKHNTDRGEELLGDSDGGEDVPEQPVYGDAISEASEEEDEGDEEVKRLGRKMRKTRIK